MGRAPAVILLALIQGMVLLGGCAAGVTKGKAGAEQPSRPAVGVVSPLAGEPDRPIIFEEQNQPRRDELYPGTGVFINPQAVSPRREVTPEEGEVTLNFEGADIREVVAMILGDLLKENYVVDPNVAGSVTLQTSRPVARSALLPILESLLKMNGAALVREQNLYRIVPVANAASGPITRSLGEAPLVSGYQTRIIPLKYIAAEEMKKILEPLVPQGGILQVDPDRNLLVVAGTAQELAHILELVTLFDVDWLRGMSVGLISVAYTDPRNIAEELEGIFGDTAQGPLAGMMRIIPMTRLNSVLVITPQPRYLDDARTWVERLDRPGEGEGRRLYVYRVQNSRAENLAEILQQLFVTERARERPAAAPQLAPGLVPYEARSPLRPSTTDTLAPLSERIRPTAQQRVQPTPQSNSQGDNALADEAPPAAQVLRQPATAALSGEPSIAEIGEVRVIAERANNALVILATPADYTKVEAAIRQLDVLPLQVLVEASIVEVTLSGDLSYGLQWFFKNSANVLGGNKTGEAQIGAPLTFPPSFSYTVTDAAGQVRALLRLLAAEDKINVISSPSLMVLDNQRAAIRVGDQQPISTSIITEDGVIAESVQFKDTGVILEVIPRVNAGGLVTMEISQEVTDVGQVDEATGQRAFLQRSIQSTVAVQSGETVVLGGLIRDNQSRAQSGVPVLHKMPIIGPLFGQTVNRSDRTELLVLLTPRAVRNQIEAREITEEFRKKLKNLGPMDHPYRGRGT